MGFIKGVVGERHQDIPKSLNTALGVPIRHHAVVELDELFVQHVFLLLPHGFTQDIGLPQGESRDFLSDGHHLFLIDNQTVGIAQDIFQGFFQFEVNGFYTLQTVFPQGIVHVGIRPHGTGAIQRHQSRDIFEFGGAQGFQQGPHPPAVQLEHSQRFPRREQLVGRGIVQRQPFEVRWSFVVDADIVQGIRDDGEVL